MRRTIFDILKDSTSPKSQSERIWNLVRYAFSISIKNYRERQEVLSDFISKYCFSEWKGQRECSDFHDFCKTLDIDNLISTANDDEDNFLLFLEVIYNLWHLAYLKISDSTTIRGLAPFNQIKRMLDDCLEKLNYEALYQKDKEQVHLREKNAAVREVVETEPNNDVAIDILRYNYRELKGNVKEKKKILIQMGASFEPYRNQLENLGGSPATLADNIFNILNNMDLRHNNIDPSDSGKYREFVATMPDEEKEKWYDELYRMLLLAKLEINNIERRDRIKPLLDGLKK